MRKRFVRVMLFGALALAASTAVTSCKDYDDDVKNLQEQIDKITSTNPVSTEDMKTAINSAVASLQTQLNAIADKADKTAVAELKAAVTALQTALNGKADAAQITELQNQITALTGTVNASIDQKVGAAKTELQAKIDALQSKLEQADADAAVQVAKDLAAAKNELKALIEANADKIVDLETKIGELEGIKSRIDALEAAHADFAKKADLAGYVTNDALNAYMNSEELKGYIDEQLVGYLTSDQVTDKIGAVQTYVDGLFKTALMADIKATYLSLEQYNSDMELLNERISKFVNSESVAYKKIFTDIENLQRYQSETLEALVESITKEGGISDKVEKFNNALGDITDLTQALAGCAKTGDLDNYVKSADLNNSIATYMTATYGDLSAQLTDIKKRLKALEIDVDGLKSMVQSVMYIPTSAQGDQVNFSSYYVKPTDGAKVLVAANDAVKVKFRVSPVSAAKDFLKNYTTSFDAQVITRAANVFESVGTPEVNEKEGVITFVLSTTTEDCHAVCLNIVAKNQTVPPVVTGDEDNNGTDYFTNISSNYFPVIVNTHTISTVEVVSKDNANEIFYDKPLSKVDYKTGSSLKVKTDKSGEAWITLSDVNLDNFITTYKFKLDDEKKPMDGEGKFQIVEGVLSLKEYTDAASGKSAEVQAIVAIKGVATGYTGVTSFTKVTAKKSSKPIVTYDLAAAAGKLKYNGAADQIIAKENFPISTIVRDASIALDNYKAIPEANFTVEAAANSGVKFIVDHANGNELTVIVPKGTVAGTYAPKLIVQASDVKTFEVTTSVTVTYDDAIVLVIDGNIVKNNALDLEPEYAGSYAKPTDVSFTWDLTSLYTNYDKIKADAEEVGGVVKLALKDDVKGVSISGTQLTVNKTYNANVADAKAIVIVAKTVFGNTDKGELNTTINLVDISGTWKFTTRTAKFDKDNLNNTLNLAKTASWTDYRGQVMWADGSETDITKGGKDAWGAAPLSVYGFTAPTFAVAKTSAANAKYVSVTTDGKISLTQAGRNLTSSVTVIVDVNAASNWGTIAGYDAVAKTITVTVNLSKEAE